MKKLIYVWVAVKKPIHKIRDRLCNPYAWRRFIRKVECFFCPSQRWLTKKIPREWADKDHIIELVCLECLRDYAENELTLRVLINPRTYEDLEKYHCPEQREFTLEVVEHYGLLLKIDSLKQEMEWEWARTPPYDKIDALEKEIDELTTKILQWMVIRRKEMWT